MRGKIIRNAIIAGALSTVLVVPSFSAQAMNAHFAVGKAAESQTKINKHIEEERFETKGSCQLKDDKVLFEFELINHYTESKQLQFGSGQQFEIIITDEEGKEVYRYSDNKFFTLALIFRDIGPGESIKWQDEWDMTDKEGEKLTSGKYKAEINIMAILKDNDEIIDENQLKTTVDFDLTELKKEDIINPDSAKEIIEETANRLIRAISIRDAEMISDFVHPEKGVRFTPYTTVSLEHDVVFDKEEMKNFFNDDNVYLWGYYDGKGDEINLTPSEYYKKFIYTKNFANAEKVGYNEVLSSGNMIENQFEVYDNAIVVEYYFSGFNPEYAGMDWRSIRLVFEQYENNWYLVGIINNQWTI